MLKHFRLLGLREEGVGMYRYNCMGLQLATTNQPTEQTNKQTNNRLRSGWICEEEAKKKQAVFSDYSVSAPKCTAPKCTAPKHATCDNPQSTHCYSAIHTYPRQPTHHRGSVPLTFLMAILPYTGTLQTYMTTSSYSYYT